MPKRQLPRGLQERIREREESKKKKTLDPEQLKRTVKQSVEGQKQLQKQQEKLEKEASNILLEELDKNQLLALLLAQQQEQQAGGLDVPDGAASAAGQTEEAVEGEEDDENMEAMDLFNTMFAALEENQKRTEEMHNKYEGMNAMAQMLLASNAPKQKELDPNLELAQNARAKIGEGILERLGREQQQTEEQQRAQQLIQVLTDSLVPQITARQAATKASKKAAQPKTASQSNATARQTNTPAPAESDRRKKLRAYFEKFSK